MSIVFSPKQQQSISIMSQYQSDGCLNSCSTPHSAPSSLPHEPLSVPKTLQFDDYQSTISLLETQLNVTECSDVDDLIADFEYDEGDQPSILHELQDDMVRLSVQVARPGPAGRSVTQLHDAASAGLCRRLDELLAAGVGVDGRNTVGQTPLMVAAMYGNAKIVRKLVNAGANVNVAGIRGETPLYIAARNGRVEVARLLLRLGAAPAAATVAGVTAAHAAASLPSSASCTRLLTLLPPPLLRSISTHGISPLHCALLAGQPVATALLLRAGLRPGAGDARGRSGGDYWLAGGCNAHVEHVVKTAVGVDLRTLVSTEVGRQAAAAAAAAAPSRAALQLAASSESSWEELDEGRGGVNVDNLFERDCLGNRQAAVLEIILGQNNKDDGRKCCII